MRTTLDVDEDVLLAVKERAREAGTSAGRVISDLARTALTGQVVARPPVMTRNGFPVLPSRGGVVTNELIDQIREEEGI